MNRQVDAVYENGVLRPLEPLPLKEHQKVSVTVSDTEDSPGSMIDGAFVESARKEIRHADHIPSMEEVRGILSRIPGSLAADIGGQREDRF
jgi:predicted DNA-binding antitoxin AbrB/MazE fold protein